MLPRRGLHRRSPIWPMPERGPQQIADRDGRQIALRARCLKRTLVGAPRVEGQRSEPLVGTRFDVIDLEDAVADHPPFGKPGVRDVAQ